MNADAKRDPAQGAKRTTAERRSERELVVTRMFDAPPRIVFQAWAKAELFARWWVPKSSGARLLSCEMDVRTGGGYRLEFEHPASGQPVAFYGKYIEVLPDARIVWTNDESEGGAVTTVTFEEKDGRTWVVLHELYPSKEALDEAVASGSTSAFDEQFAQLDEFLASSPAR